MVGTPFTCVAPVKSMTADGASSSTVSSNEASSVAPSLSVTDTVTRKVPVGGSPDRLVSPMGHCAVTVPVSGPASSVISTAPGTAREKPPAS